MIQVTPFSYRMHSLSNLLYMHIYPGQTYLGKDGKTLEQHCSLLYWGAYNIVETWLKSLVPRCIMVLGIMLFQTGVSVVGQKETVLAQCAHSSRGKLEVKARSIVHELKIILVELVWSLWSCLRAKDNPHKAVSFLDKSMFVKVKFNQKVRIEQPQG